MEAAQVSFLDTWKVVGLKGTNSCDFAASEVFVPTERTFVAFGGTSCLDGPMGRISAVLGLMPGHAAVGLASPTQRATSLHGWRRPRVWPSTPPGLWPATRTSSAPWASFPADRGSRGLMEKQTAIVWDAATAGETLDTVSKMRARMVAPYVTALCCQAVDRAYTLAGSTSLYDTSSLQRRLRDIHVATQHLAVSSSATPRWARPMTGQELFSPIDRTA